MARKISTLDDLLSQNRILKARKDRPMYEAYGRPPYQKLPNKLIEGYHLELNGKNLGDFVLAAIHQDNGGAVWPTAKDGHHFSTEELLRKEDVEVQRRSLSEHQRLSVNEALDEIRNPRNQTYGHYFGMVRDNDSTDGWKGVSFAVGELRRFRSSRRGAVNMYYIPQAPEEFEGAFVVKGKERIPLKQFMIKESMKHIGVNSGLQELLAIYDAPPKEYNEKLKQHGYKALKPLIGVPSLQGSRKEVADNVHIVVHPPTTGESADVYKYGVPLAEAVAILRTYVDEGYKWTRNLYADAVRGFFKSAVSVGGKPIVPYSDTNFQELGIEAKPLSIAQSNRYLKPPAPPEPPILRVRVRLGEPKS